MIGSPPAFLQSFAALLVALFQLYSPLPSFISSSKVFLHAFLQSSLSLHLLFSGIHGALPQSTPVGTPDTWNLLTAFAPFLSWSQHVSLWPPFLLGSLYPLLQSPPLSPV